MQYIDLNLQNKALEKEALALGFSKVFFTKVIEIRNGKDFNLVNVSELTCVQSIDPELLRNCIKQKKPPLCNPLSTKDFYKDEGLILEAAQQGVYFEIPISEFLRTEFIQRSKLANQTSNFLKRCLKHDAKFVFTSRASDSLDLKSPNEMAAIISVLFNITKNQAEFAISKLPAKLMGSLK